MASSKDTNRALTDEQLEEARHEAAEAADDTTCGAGEEDPGAAAEDLAELIARDEERLHPRK